MMANKNSGNESRQKATLAGDSQVNQIFAASEVRGSNSRSAGCFGGR